MTKEEIIRIRNLGCGNDYPAVWNRQLYELCDIALAAAEREELHRMQLAAIGVSAMCNTRETAAQQRIGRDNPYWTLALEDVYRAVDREMDERERADAAEMRYIAWG